MRECEGSESKHDLRYFISPLRFYLVVWKCSWNAASVCFPSCRLTHYYACVLVFFSSIDPPEIWGLDWVAKIVAMEMVENVAVKKQLNKRLRLLLKGIWNIVCVWEKWSFSSLTLWDTEVGLYFFFVGVWTNRFLFASYSWHHILAAQRRTELKTSEDPSTFFFLLSELDTLS